MGKLKTDRKLLDSFAEDLKRGSTEEDFIWEFGDDILKEKVRKLENEHLEKDKILNNQRKQLEETLRALEEKERKTHELEILLKTMEANLHQLENERRQYLGKIEEYGKEVASLQDRSAQYEEDLKNLTSQLKARTQENILLNKENKDHLRIKNQLQETVALLEQKVRSLEHELNKIGPAQTEMEKKYNRSLDSLRNEVKAKHQEILRLDKELGTFKKANQELQRLNENLELELDMLNTTNISLQKKIEKITLQNSILEKKLQNKVVRFVLHLCAFLGWNPDRKMTTGFHV